MSDSHAIHLTRQRLPVRSAFSRPLIQRSILIAVIAVGLGPTSAGKVTARGIGDFIAPVSPLGYCALNPDKCKEAAGGAAGAVQDAAKKLREHWDVCKAIETLGTTANEKMKELSNEVIKAIEVNIPNQGFNLYDVQSSASFTYNADTGSVGYKFTLPGGVEPDKSKIKSSFEGKYSVPTVDFAALIREVGFIELKLERGYDDWAKPKKSNSDHHVYVSSKRFVDTLSDNKILQEIGWGIITGGSTAEGSIAALKEQLALEWADLLTWLQQIGAEESANSARQIIEDIFKAAEALQDNRFKSVPAPLKLPKLNGYDFEVKFHDVPYNYVVNSPFDDQFTKILKLVGYDGKVAPLSGNKVTEHHFAFSVSFGKSKTFTYQDMLEPLVSRIQKGPAIDINGLVNGISGDGQIPYGELKNVEGNEFVRGAFAETLANIVAESKYMPQGGGVFDFTKSEAGKLLEEKLKGLTFGRREDSKVTVRRLVVDVVSKTVSLDVDLANRYRVSKKDIVKLLQKRYDQLPTTLAFNNAKNLCLLAKKECQKTAVQVVAAALCISVGKKQIPELAPKPEQVARFLTPVDGPRVSESDGSSSPPLVAMDDPDEGAEVGLALPLWCFLDRYGIFEVRTNLSIRGLTKAFYVGKAKKQNDGSLNFTAERYANIGTITEGVLPWTEKVKGSIRTNGKAVEYDLDGTVAAGFCRSVDVDDAIPSRH